jgi:sugar lactone lactonase YvrE
MKKNIFYLTLFLFCGYHVNAQEEIFKSEKVLKLWETAGFDVPESVLPVPGEKIMYVSNIGGTSADAKDNNGFISVVSFNGNIKSLKWSVGLNSPKGMAILNGTLYVTDIDRIAEIDTRSGKIIQFYPVPGSEFLNDIAVTNVGTLYITDSKTKKVFLFDKGKVSEFTQSETWAFPNGIIYSDNNILVGVGDRVVAINTQTKNIEDFLMNTGGVDGLVLMDKNIFLFSDWSGKIYKMLKGSEKELLLDTSKTEKQRSADFGYEPLSKMIFVPTFLGNSIACYQLVE